MGGAIVIDNTNPSGRVPKKSKPSPTSSFDRRSAELGPEKVSVLSAGKDEVVVLAAMLGVSYVVL
jgi:hypothetical protein